MITIVDRKTRCILGWKVGWERTQAVIQLMVDNAKKAKRYFSDDFHTYSALWYHGGRHEISQAKTTLIL